VNIILNSYCNLKCNYCFADEYMEETVQSPGKSMDFGFFMNDLLPKIKNDANINFMGGEPTLHPKFSEMFSQTLESMPPYSSLGVFTNGLMPEKALDVLIGAGGRNGAISRKVGFAILLNWQTMENISEKNHQRCGEVAETLLRINGYSVTFSINLYSIEQDLMRQCEEIDAIYQKVGLPKDQMYKIRVSPAFPIVGEDLNVYLPIRQFPQMGRKMIEVVKRFPQLSFRFDCSFPPCFLDELQADEYPLTERFFFHGSQQVPPVEEWNQHHLYFGCADGSPMDIDSKGDCFNCFPFHNMKLGNVSEFKEINSIATARMGARFLNNVFEETKAKEPCRSCPHYMVRCSSGCFSYNFV
jgi:radical SAM protein with 4Fe4S-binding SPASM domain